MTCDNSFGPFLMLITIRITTIKTGSDSPSGPPYDCTTQRRSSLSPQLDKASMIFYHDYQHDHHHDYHQLDKMNNSLNTELAASKSVIKSLIITVHQVEELLQRMETLKGKQTALPPKEELTVRSL